MAIQTSGRGTNTHLIKITLGYDEITGQRLYYTETFHGKKKNARLRESELKLLHRKKMLVPSNKLTFRECFTRYCEKAKKHLSKHRYHLCEKMVNLYLMPTLGDKLLKRLVNTDFQAVYDKMKGRGLSPDTLHTLHGVTRPVFTEAVESGLLAISPLKGIKLPKIPETTPEYLDYEEMQRFFDAANEYWYGDAFKFQFLTGERNQELMAMRWEDIDLEKATARIRRACIWIDGKFEGFKPTKTEEERTIELNAPLVTFLKSVKAKQESHIIARTNRGLPYGDKRLMFCTPDGQVPYMNGVRESFRKILKQIGITRRIRWYGARHTHATQMLDSPNAKPKSIAKRLGITPERLFKTYGHEMRGQQRESLSTITARVTL